MRVGLGYDSHRFAAGRKLVLGGVEIAHPLGLAGHSDADAVAHALIDAMLGAAGLGDIGAMFPDSDPRWQGGGRSIRGPSLGSRGPPTSAPGRSSISPPTGSAGHFSRGSSDGACSPSTPWGISNESIVATEPTGSS